MLNIFKKLFKKAKADVPATDLDALEQAVLRATSAIAFLRSHKTDDTIIVRMCQVDMPWIMENLARHLKIELDADFRRELRSRVLTLVSMPSSARWLADTMREWAKTPVPVASISVALQSAAADLENWEVAL